MRSIKKSIICKYLALAVFLSLTISASLHASQAAPNKQIPALKSILMLAGIEIDVISLQRSDGFNKGLYFSSPNLLSTVVSTDNDGLFLIENGVTEVIFRLSSENGGVVVIQGEDSELSSALCVFSAIINMVEDITECAQDDLICSVMAVFTMIQSVINCDL